MDTNAHVVFGLADAVYGGTVPSGFGGTTTSTLISPNVKQGITIGGPTARVPLKLSTALASFWVKLYLYAPITVTSGYALYTAYSGTNPLFRLALANTSRVFKIETYNGTAWSTVATAATGLSSSTRYQIDIQASIADSGGAIRMYVDGSLYLEFTGDTLTNTATTADSVEIGGLNSSTSSYLTIISSLMIREDDTRQAKIYETSLTGAGGYAEMTGAYTDVDELGSINDADKLVATAAGQRSTFAKSALPAGADSGMQVSALVVGARGLRSADATITGVNLLAESGATLGESATKPLDVSFSPVNGIFVTDPNTSAAWTFSAVDAAKVGIKSVA